MSTQLELDLEGNANRTVAARAARSAPNAPSLEKALKGWVISRRVLGITVH
jgi:hypothetical protein